ncbi:MAG: hypothetical protein ACM3VZ_05335 [Acidobacteriota bacterium]
MSHDQGRPSLFAGMEDGASPGSDTQRVSILSTLESSRRPHRPARKGPPSGGATQAAANRAWAITLGLGGVALLISFVLIIQSQHPTPARLAPANAVNAAPAATLAPPAPLTATATLPAAEPASAAEPAVTAVVPASGPLDALAPTAASRVPQDTDRDPLAALDQAAANRPASAPVAPVKKPVPAPKAAAVATPNAKNAKPAKARRNEDVELIEAVMTHASSRPAAR